MADAPKDGEFVLGDFVINLDESKQAAFGSHPGVVLRRTRLKEDPKAETYVVRVLERTVVCAVSQLERVEVQQSAFPLADLPTPALALIMFFLPVRHAGRLTVVSHKFAAAFRDNVSWKRRCVAVIKRIDVEAVFAAEKETSWLAFFRRHSGFRIRIVTVVPHRGGRSISEDFTIECDPWITVAEFLSKVAAITAGGTAILLPHDPRRLGRRGPDGTIPEKPDAKPNCEFRKDNLYSIISEAGLCDGAVLEQPGYLMRD